MAISYKKLWKLLIDREMTKTAMRKEAGITTAALAKLGKNEHVSTEVLAKICAALHCDITDIMEFTECKTENLKIYKEAETVSEKSEVSCDE